MNVPISSPAVAAGSTCLYVDSGATAATGQKGKINKPYSTPTAAKNAAVSGDTIHVLRGMFNEKNLLKNGVNWIFYPGTGIAVTTASVGGIFDDSVNGANTAITCKITGWGDFSVTAATNSTATILTCSKPNSNIYFQANKLSHTVLTGEFACVIQGLTSTGTNQLICDVQEVICGSIAFWWTNGNGHVDCKRIITTLDSTALYATPGGVVATPIGDTTYFGGDWYINTDHIDAQGGCSIRCSGVPEARVWHTFKTLYSKTTLTGGFWIDGTRYYGIGEKIKDASRDGSNQGGVFIAPATGCEAYLNVQKVAVNSNVLFIGSDGDKYVNIDQLEGWNSDQSADLNAYAVIIDGGTGKLHIGALVGSAWQSGVAVLSGTVRLSGLIDTSAAANNYPIESFAQGTWLQDLELIAHSSKNGVYAADPQTVNVTRNLTVNKAKHANITYNPVAPGEVVVASLTR